MKILLICAAGMSTSLVKKKIVAAFGPEEEGWTINAEAYEKLESVIKDYDVILLGPQIANKYNKPLSTINPVDYGMGNGANILEQIKKMINE